MGIVGFHRKNREHVVLEESLMFVIL